MRTILIIFIFAVSLVFSCKVSERRVYTKISNLNKISYDLYFSKKSYTDDLIFIENTTDIERLISLQKKQNEKVDNLLKKRELFYKNKEVDSNKKIENVLDSSDDISLGYQLDNTADTISDTSDDIDLSDNEIAVKMDTTSDTSNKNLSPNSDETEDSIDFSKYLLDLKKVNYYKAKKDFLKSLTYNELAKPLAKYSIGFRSKDDISSDIKNEITLSIEIFSYNLGEFNLIKNVPTEIGITVDLLNGKKKLSYFKKWYKCESLIENPTENLRLSKIAKDLSKDIILLIETTSNKKLSSNEKSTIKK